MADAETTFPQFPSGMSPYRSTSGLASAPVGRDVEEIQELYFPSATVDRTHVVEVVSENDVSPSLVEQISYFVDENANGFLDAGEQVYYAYVVKVFVSKDASYLKQAFDSCTPAANEVCFFLEDNGTDFMSDRSAYVSIGTDFQRDLGLLTMMTQYASSSLGVAEAIGDTPIDFTTAEIAELIATGKISDPARETWITVFQAVNVQSMVLGPLYGAIGDGILYVTKALRGYITFSEKHWDPERPDFSPILSAVQLGAIEAYETLSEEAIGAIARALRTALREQEATFTSYADEFLKSGYVSAYSETFVDFMKEAFAKVRAFTDELIARIEDIVRTLAALGSHAVNAINAFCCGLWNGLVEIVLGLVDLVGYLFVGLGAVGEAVSDAQTLIPEALEFIDETVQTLLEIDVTAMTSEALAALQDEVGRLNLYALTATITVEKVAYFIGQLVGFIVDVALGLIYSGGLKSLSSLAAKFGKVGEATLETVLAGAKKALGEAAEFSIKSVMPIVRKILMLLRKGKQGIREAIGAIFDALEQAAKLGADVLDQAYKKLKLTADEIASFEDAGLTPVKYGDEGLRYCMVREPAGL